MLHIRLFENVPPEKKPQGIPDVWPAETRPDVIGPPPPGWLAMTREEYSTYRSQHQHEYDVWQAAQIEEQKAAEAAKVASPPELKEWIMVSSDGTQKARFWLDNNGFLMSEPVP